MALELNLTTKEDLQSVLKIENQAENVPFIGAYTMERHREVIDNSDELHLAFKDQGRLIGYAILQGLDNPNDAIEFKRITIAEKGKGYGRAAIKGVKEYCFEKLNCHCLWLDVFDFNFVFYPLFFPTSVPEQSSVWGLTKYIHYVHYFAPTFLQILIYGFKIDVYYPRFLPTRRREIISLLEYFLDLRVF